MAKQLAPIDITHTPELLRLAEEVHTTNAPRVLRRNNEDIAVVMPVTSIPNRLKSTTTRKGSVAAGLAAGYQSVPALNRQLSVEEMVEIAAEEHALAVAREGL